MENVHSLSLGEWKTNVAVLMLQKRPNSLSLMYIESDLLLSLDFEDAIVNFAYTESRKMSFISVQQ